MVMFSCSSCGSVLKKQLLENHRCLPRSYSCCDCLESFGEDYITHYSCVTENQKYGNVNAKLKIKDQNKLMWTQSVIKATQQRNDAPVQKLLDALKNKEDIIPNKRQKFKNFLQNLNLYQCDLSQSDNAFDCIKNCFDNAKGSVEKNSEKEVYTKNDEIDKIDEPIEEVDTKKHKRTSKKNKHTEVAEPEEELNVKKMRKAKKKKERIEIDY